LFHMGEFLNIFQIEIKHFEITLLDC